MYICERKKACAEKCKSIDHIFSFNSVGIVENMERWNNILSILVSGFILTIDIWNENIRRKIKTSCV